MVPMTLRYTKCLILAALLSTICLGQTDEIRQATGLPIPIGQPVIYGRVTISGMPRNQRKPSVFVSLIVSGTQFDRRQTNDDGYYYFLVSPSDGSTLVFEVDNSEIGRIVLTSGVGGVVRQDITVNWNMLTGSKQASPGVVSVSDGYQRSSENLALFSKAMEAAKKNESETAISILQDLLKRDENDFPAWTELGNLFFKLQRFKEAEEAYTKALEKDSDSKILLKNLGKAYFTDKKYEKAIEYMLRSAKVEPNSAETFQVIGESFLALKQGSKAEIALKEALRLDPIGKAEIHLRLAALYNAAGLKKEAVEQYEQFLTKKPDYPEKDKLLKYIKENTKENTK